MLLEIPPAPHNFSDGPSLTETKLQALLFPPRRLFPFRKRSLPFLTVDAIIGNQACSIADVIVYSGMCYDKAISNFFKSS